MLFSRQHKSNYKPSLEEYYLAAVQGLAASGKYNDNEKLVQDAMDIAVKAFENARKERKDLFDTLFGGLKKKGSSTKSH
jgi:hypothetical protein